MALYVAQAYGYCENEGTISWEMANSSDTSDGNVFADLASSYTVGSGNIKIYQIGIQTLPGVKFIINNNQVSSGAYVIVGQTGIFELNLTDSNSTAINTVKFSNLTNILSASDDGLNTGYILIDVIFEPTT